MRSAVPRYPVDRYLVESSNKFEIVNIIDDDIWSPEPTLRPEDEIMLRKLHDMLQSTADDLKLLSGELSKFHEPGVQVKSAPTPLDEEFNEKVHIEEVVNAKFHGYKIVEKPTHVPHVKPRMDTIDGANVNRTSKVLNTDVKPKPTSIYKRPVLNKNLGVTRTRIMQIDSNNQESVKKEMLNNSKVINSAPAVAYNEFSFKYVESKSKVTSHKNLQVQDMPSINIRSELKEQKVLQLDIIPESKEATEIHTTRSNVSVVAITHGVVPKPSLNKPYESALLKQTDSNNQPIRKISKMSTCESSGSTNNIDSDSRAMQNTQKRIISTIRNSPKMSARERTKKSTSIRKEADKHQRYSLDEWKKKLSIVYGPTYSKKSKTRSIKSPKKLNNSKKPTTHLNNSEYIPSSHLTLGGVRVSDIEREISDLPNKTDLPLSPILDKILSSRENSFHKERSTKNHQKDHNNPILTTSDENLLQEVIEIERSVSQTLSKNLKKKVNEPVVKSQNVSSESNNAVEENESYADDFEDDKSEQSGKSSTSNALNEDEAEEKSLKIKYINKDGDSSDNDDNFSITEPQPGPSNIKNTTYTKASSLSFKDSVDIFEFVHLVDTHDTATQSDGESKITPKETQTSPRNDRPNIQPIHNDLWSSIDPRREVEKMFELEKDFIKKLIIDEYGDLLEKNINKPSTSKENSQDTRKNVTALQKNTQTSPAHVKSVMTSPRKTKTRPTSPFLLSVPVHQQTSPLVVVTNQDEQCVDVGVEADNISVNLSSPRFSLRLPQTSREVLSNLGDPTPPQSKPSLKRNQINNKTFTKISVSSSSSVDADNSSSEISSLGEIRIRKKLKKRAPSISECSSSSTVSKYSYDLQSAGILPLRSEGEISLTQASKKTVEKRTKSDGETSFGQK